MPTLYHCFLGCSKAKFTRRRDLIRHLKCGKHSLEFVVEPLKAGRPYQENRDADLYGCPACMEAREQLEQVHSHFMARHQPTSAPSQGPDQDSHSDDALDSTDDALDGTDDAQEGGNGAGNGGDDAENGDDDESGSPTGDMAEIASRIIVDPSIQVSSAPVPTPRAPQARTYDEAVIYACQQAASTDADQAKTLWIVEKLELEPFSIVFNDGYEENALTSPRIIERSLGQPPTTIRAIPKKRPFDAMAQDDATIADALLPRDLSSVLAISPYRRTLHHRHYAEINEELGQIANKDWRLHPAAKFAVAQLFAGAILLRTDTHQAIILNTIEVYGRSKTVDSHREVHQVRKGIPIAMSLPPSAIPMRYADVYPVSVAGKDGMKLMVGTLTCNILVTSSLRIDKEEMPSVGATTSSFLLNSTTESNACMIFLDTESIRKCLAIVNDQSAQSASTTGLYLPMLRQLNSKYDDPRAFLLTRCSGHITRAYPSQPITVFTLADHGNSKNSGAVLMSEVATKVLQDGNRATLTRSFMTQLRAKCQGKMARILDDILALMQHDSSVAILHNRQLSLKLEEIATQLHPLIASANKAVQATILSNFKSAN